MQSVEIDTAAKRARLEPRKNPYWVGVSGGRGGVSLGYRRSATGPGVWVAKIVIDGRRVEERIGSADDKSADNGKPYRAAVAEALDWSRRQHEAITAAADTGTSQTALTVRTAVEAYCQAAKRRSLKAGTRTENSLKFNVLSDRQFAELPLKKLRASSIEAWRARLPLAEYGDDQGRADGRLPISASTVNRILNNVRAALNAAAEKHRRELPPHLTGEIKVGTKAMLTEANARKQFLNDAEVQTLIAAAFDFDEDGDFGRLVLMLAATGARYSQVTSILVGDLQAAQRRVMVPRSNKGRGTKSTSKIAVPLSPEILERLRPAFEGRPATEPLLQRWQSQRGAAKRWERNGRRAWRESEMFVPWASVRAAAGLSADVVPYALRHTSILRGLNAGLPVRLVASLHDTSVEMIEAHYSAFIVDASEELARRAMLTAPAKFAEAAE